jgi:hypothetical protein
MFLIFFLTSSAKTCSTWLLKNTSYKCVLDLYIWHPFSASAFSMLSKKVKIIVPLMFIQFFKAYINETFVLQECIVVHYYKNHLILPPVTETSLSIGLNIFHYPCKVCRLLDTKSLSTGSLISWLAFDKMQFQAKIKKILQTGLPVLCAIRGKHLYFPGGVRTQPHAYSHPGFHSGGL